MEARVRVRYAETDQMGVVYHANYLVWMEIGRVELCRSRGVNYRDFEARSGIRMGVVEATCRYHAPARYDDEVIVKTSLVSANARVVKFGYEMYHGQSGTKLATGHTVHVFLDADFRTCRLPAEYYDVFGVER